MNSDVKIAPYSDEMTTILGFQLNQNGFTIRYGLQLKNCDM